MTVEKELTVRQSLYSSFWSDESMEAKRDSSNFNTKDATLLSW